jgi:DNA-binding transcriptional ArsR family regulator
MEHNTNPTQIDGTRIEYPEGQAHGVTVYVQLNDDNGLYDRLTDAQRRLNNERGQNADSENPHDLGPIDASWTDGVDTVGFFSSRVPYGDYSDGKFTQYYTQVLNLYDDIDTASIAHNPAKCRVEVHKRESGLCYEDGNEYTWPAGWITGQQHEGTCLKIQLSYINSPGEGIARAFELIEGTGLVSRQDLASPITETVRFSGLESHHRVHKNHEKDLRDTLKDSASLVGTKGDGTEKGDIEAGHYQKYAFRNNRIDFLGFDASLSWEYRGDEYTDSIEQHYLKVYRHTNAEDFAETTPQAHPKIEIKADGAYPGPAWSAVKHQLDTILNAHTSDFAGVPTKGLVEDLYHDGPNQDTVITPSPNEYRINLREYFTSHGLKKDIISLLVNNRTDSAKDILYTVIRLGRKVTYDELKAETGLTKRTIRKWVKRLEELAIVDRIQSGKMFIRMTEFVREHLRSWIDKIKPVGDTKREIRNRKQERIKARESNESDSPTPATVATDGGSEIRASPRDTTETPHTPPPAPAESNSTGPPD